MKFRWLIVMSVVMSACSAAADVAPSASPDTLPLFDETTDAVEPDGEQSTSSSSTSIVANTDDEPSESTTTQAVGQTTVASTAPPTPTSTTVAPTSVVSTTTTPQIDPNAEFCRAAVEIDELGTFTSLDDTEAATIFFNAQVERWDAAAEVAPAPIAADTQTVATFYGEMRTLLAANDFDLFAVFEELTELETSSGSDIARIRVDQFVFANCGVTPPLAEQATAAFYGGLLDSTEDRTYLAELLASAEVFSLDGSQCFVDRATPDAMHPLVGAPATPDQEAALSSVLSACQITIGA